MVGRWRITEMDNWDQEAVDLVQPAARPAPSPGNTARTAKVGRNAPCPCGSGKKFKKCCGSRWTDEGPNVRSEVRRE